MTVLAIILGFWLLISIIAGLLIGRGIKVLRADESQSRRATTASVQFSLGHLPYPIVRVRRGRDLVRSQGSWFHNIPSTAVKNAVALEGKTRR